MLPRIYKSAVQQFITQDKALSFTSPINDAPAYWKKFLLEALAMIKQLSIPTAFNSHVQIYDGRN